VSIAPKNQSNWQS